MHVKCRKSALIPGDRVETSTVPSGRRSPDVCLETDVVTMRQCPSSEMAAAFQNRRPSVGVNEPWPWPHGGAPPHPAEDDGL